MERPTEVIAALERSGAAPQSARVLIAYIDSIEGKQDKADAEIERLHAENKRLYAKNASLEYELAQAQDRDWNA